VTSHQSVRQTARRSALDAQAVLRKERADRERRLEGLAVAVLTALGERDGAVRDTERRAGQALQTMTEDEGCRSARRPSGAAVAPSRCGRSPGYANLRTTRWAATADKRACIDRLGHSLSHQSGNPLATTAGQPHRKQPNRAGDRWRRRLVAAAPASSSRPDPGGRYVHVSCGHRHRPGRCRGSRTGDA
jgi:hypothetical protein